MFKYLSFAYSKKITLLFQPSNLYFKHQCKLFQDYINVKHRTPVFKDSIEVQIFNSKSMFKKS